jgi:hypothetical protein
MTLLFLAAVLVQLNLKLPNNVNPKVPLVLLVLLVLSSKVHKVRHPRADLLSVISHNTHRRFIPLVQVDGAVEVLKVQVASHLCHTARLRLAGTLDLGKASLLDHSPATVAFRQGNPTRNSSKVNHQNLLQLDLAQTNNPPLLQLRPPRSNPRNSLSQRA